MSKFVLGFGDVAGDATATDAVDLAMLARLDAVLVDATTAFDGFDYARALERTEEFFWWFCDDYVELVKSRAYGSRGDDAATSARVALRTALEALQALFAPLLPFSTEEAWSWWHDSSVHVAPWPAPSGAGTDASALDPVLAVLALVRRAKTEAKASQRAKVARLTITAPAEMHPAIHAGAADLVDAGTIAEWTLVTGDELSADIELAPPE